MSKRGILFKASALLLALALLIAGCSAPGSEDAEPTPDGALPSQEETPSASGEESGAPSSNRLTGLTFTPGTYTAQGNGVKGTIDVTVTFSETEIVSIEVGANQETLGIGDVAIERMPKNILATQSLATDTISGATGTSNGILEAVENCVIQANGDVERMKQPLEEIEITYKEETIECDIVVVGAGASGMAATIQAAQNGADVVLLERAARLGGNGAETEGMFAAGSPLQQEAGIPTMPLEDILEAENEFSNYRSDVFLWSKFVKSTADNVQWLLDLGVEFDGVSSYSGISDFPCFHWWKGGEGDQMGKQLGDTIKSMENVDLRIDTKATELIFNDSGEILGVNAINDTDGIKYEVYADAVILATGGFGGDNELVEMMTDWDMTYGGSRSPLSTGEGLRMALSAGANTTSTCILPKDYVYGFSPYDAISHLVVQPLLYFNQDGQRFMREDLGLTDYLAKKLNAINTQKSAWVLVDGATMDRFTSGEGLIRGWWPFATGDTIPEAIEQLQQCLDENRGNVYYAETLADLESQMGIEAGVLQSTVERYNQFCAAGEDTDFKKYPENLYPVGEGPYYAVRIDRNVTVTIGGIDVDLNNNVVDTQGNIIPHLYAVGVDGCELYKETYNYGLSGGMVSYCIYSGRNAANDAWATYCN